MESAIPGMFKASVPVLTLMVPELNPPVWLWRVVSVTAPLPFFTKTEPVPLMGLGIVTLSLWLNTSVFPAPVSMSVPVATLPVVPPLPICTVPAAMVSAPEKLLLLAMISTPLPFFVTPVAPAMPKPPWSV